MQKISVGAGRAPSPETSTSEAVTKCVWQPIETAPKGREVLIARPAYANTLNSPMEMFVAAYISGAHGPGWCTGGGYEIFRATHWTPLPAPPPTAEGGKRASRDTPSSPEETEASQAKPQQNTVED